MGEINKGAVALIVVLLIGASGYLWYSKMYQPAVAARTTAQASAKTAEEALAAAKAQLATATKQVEDSRKETAKLDDSVARLAKARTAIPDAALIDDAAIVLVEMAQRSGVQTSFKAGNEGGTGSTPDPTVTGGLQGAVPMDLEFKAAGTYAEMMQFMALVEGNVEVKDDKLFTRGRLFNVVKLEIGADEEEQSGGGGFGEESASDDDGFILGPNDIIFKVFVRMYTSSTDNSESVGTTTPDPAAAATTDPNAAASTDPNAAATTDPNAAATTDPDAVGTGAPSTDGAATTDTGTPATTTTGGI